MKKAQIIGISIALVAGLAAFVGMRQLVSVKPTKIVQKETVDAVKVLVAKANIPLGTITNEQSFRWQEWPKAALSPSFITQDIKPNALRDMSQRIARSPLLAGEPITDNKLIKAGSGGVLAAILPPGMRAISTKITEVTAAGKLILPNDHVDVILTQRKRGKAGTEEHVSDILFRNVRVLAIGQTLEAKEGKKNADGNVATLELSPQQAEGLALANTMGDISLALRSIADISSESRDVGAGLGKKDENSSSIRVLRYGVKARVYGIN